MTALRFGVHHVRETRKRPQRHGQRHEQNTSRCRCSARCETEETAGGCALGLLMGDELILAELWPSAENARARALALRAHLLTRGWLEQD